MKKCAWIIGLALVSSVSLAAASYSETDLASKTYRQQTMYQGSPDLAACALNIPLQGQAIAYSDIIASLSPVSNPASSSGLGLSSNRKCTKSISEGKQVLNNNSTEPVITVICTDTNDVKRTGTCTYIAN